MGTVGFLSVCSLPKKNSWSEEQANRINVSPNKKKKDCCIGVETNMWYICLSHVTFGLFVLGIHLKHVIKLRFCAACEQAMCVPRYVSNIGVCDTKGTKFHTEEPRSRFQHVHKTTHELHPRRVCALHNGNGIRFNA